MANLAVVKICLCLLLVLFTAMPTTASAAQKSDRFRKAHVSFTEHLVFDQPAKSRVHCVVLCSGTPCCDRAIFAEGKCRGHRWTPECGGNVTTVWERARGGYTDPVWPVHVLLVCANTCVRACVYKCMLMRVFS